MCAAPGRQLSAPRSVKAIIPHELRIMRNFHDFQFKELQTSIFQSISLANVLTCSKPSNFQRFPSGVRSGAGIFSSSSQRRDCGFRECSWLLEHYPPLYLTTVVFRSEIAIEGRCGEFEKSRCVAESLESC